jgi:hypothetical protein
MTELELTSLLFQLADHNVTGIKVKYDGGGDSGAIEWIGYTTEKCETPEDVNDRVEDWETKSALTNLGGDLYNLIEEFVEEKLLNDIEDWWNNEGGWGDVAICVPSGKYVINNKIRITDHEEFFHDGDLLSKTEEE